MSIGIAIAAVVLGAVIIIASARPRVPVLAQPAARAREVAQLARRLELAHNLAGRLLQTRWNPRRLDLEYVAGGVVDSYQRALASAWIMERAQLLDPLLELEELLERLESFTARVRSWRPGRARGKR